MWLVVQGRCFAAGPYVKRNQGASMMLPKLDLRTFGEELEEATYRRIWSQAKIFDMFDKGNWPFSL
jgi:hypothetical protein